MASKRHAAQQEESDIDLTPMLDVVFIMLIFFIVTASFIKEAGLEIERPDTTTNTPPPPNSEVQNILVRVNAASDIEIDNRRVDVRSVRAIIQRKLAENPQGSVIINAHPEAKSNTYTQVADAAKLAKAGVPVSIVVKP